MNELQRFLDAQRRDYATALAEVRKGKKQSHWMWYIFPQIAGLGHSETARYYAIKDLKEADDYLKHEVLGTRLVEISRELLLLSGNDARKIFGSPDDLKLRSSMTLFTCLPDTDVVFQAVLDKFFGGAKDERTLALIN